ncbi:MAG: tetratricopeptide repeat protein [Deltaproteobacteria bacterium]|nr:tetratricopeptide repeat protein [Deltaproteobacteria bacterium]
MKLARTASVVVVVAALFAGGLVGCAGSLVAKPPAPEDEVARLKREVTKIRFAVDSTKGLIERSRGQGYLPDLYLRLAELYVEEARFHYFIAYEGQKRRERAVDSVQARLLKNQAIGVYKRILDEFPQYVSRDKVLFFIAHEFRELGDYPQMLGYLRSVVDEHPKSPYRNEALLVLGDYYFDKGELDVAEKNYREIVATEESPSHGMARYKLAWCRINKEDWKAALDLFEATIVKLNERAEKATEEGQAIGKKLDLRREALVDMVFPYTEVHKKPDMRKSLEYFGRLADSRTSYLAALNKLARRWFVKGEYQIATGVYRELLALGGGGEDSIEWGRRLFDGVQKGKLFDRVADDAQILGEIVASHRGDWRIPEKERLRLYGEFEAYTRDLATKAQLEAQEAKADQEKSHARVADAYERYLEVFGDAPAAKEIRMNLAESRFAANQSFAAGRAYLNVIVGTSGQERRDSVYTAVSAFDAALKKSWALTRLDLMRARAGLRRAARIFVSETPKDEKAVAVKFNYARSFYDEGRFDEAADLFAALVEEFPTAAETIVAAELALDALRADEKFEAMAVLGKRLASDERLPSSLRSDIQQIVASAESRALEVATLNAGYQGEEASEGLMTFAERHKGSDLGEKALVNAFATAQNSDDLDAVTKIGEQVMTQYPNSDLVPNVLATLGKMHARAADFARAASYFESAAAKRPSDPASADFMKAAASLKAKLGDLAGAESAYGPVMSGGDANRRREAALALADLMEEARDYGRMARALEIAVSAGADSPATSFRLGYAAYASGKGDATRHFKAAAAGAGGSADDAEGVAGAEYFLAEPDLEAYRSISPKGDPGQVIQKKFQALSVVEERMVKVIERGSSVFALAALMRLAEAYELGAKFLVDTPTPAGLTGANEKQYRTAMETKANELKEKSSSALATCASKASELKVFSVVAKACLEGRVFQGDPLALPPRPGGRAAELNSGEASELRKTIAKNSKDFGALQQLATLYLKAGDPLTAGLVLDKAAEGGADPATYNLRGVVRYRLGDPQGAYEDWKSALDGDATNLRARLNLAALFAEYGFKNLAEAERAKAQGAESIRTSGDVALIESAGRGG